MYNPDNEGSNRKIYENSLIAVLKKYLPCLSDMVFVYKPY